MLTEKKQEDKEKTPRLKKLKVDLSKLSESIVEGKFIVPVGERVFFERSLNGKTRTHAGVVRSVEESGVVQIWDDTREQWFIFNVNDAKVPVIKF